MSEGSHKLTSLPHFSFSGDGYGWTFEPYNRDALLRDRGAGAPPCEHRLCPALHADGSHHEFLKCILGPECRSQPGERVGAFPSHRLSLVDLRQWNRSFDSL